MTFDAFGRDGPGRNLNTQVVQPLRVEGGGTISDILLGFVRQQFQRHLNEVVANSLAGFHSVAYTLPDGSLMHVQSNSGIHQITVRPAPAPQVQQLPHGFVVVTPDNDDFPPAIYGRYTTDGSTWAWEFKGAGVPQAISPIEGYNQVLRTPDLVLPLVLNLERDQVIDYWAHAGWEGEPSGKHVVPINAKIVDVEYETHGGVHFAVDDGIQLADGTELYQVAATDNILLDESDEQHAWPAASDSSGNWVVLGHWRYAILSESAAVWQFRFCNEVLERTAAAVYTQVERNVVDILTPLAEATVTTSQITAGDLDEPRPSGDLFLEIPQSLRSTSYGGFSVWEGFSWAPVAFFDITESEVATREEVEEENGETTTEKVVALPGADGVHYVTVTNALNFVDDVFWRSGTSSAAVNMLTLFLPTGYYGIIGRSITRRDMHWWVDGTPSVTLDLGWALGDGIPSPNTEYAIFEGTVQGRMDGRYYVDAETRKANHFPVQSRDAYVIQGLMPSFTAPPPVFDQALAYAQANDIKASVLATMAPYHNGSGGQLDLSEVTDDERPANTGQYSFTSRHIIDYDHRGRFLAAIAVTVTCTGAAWEEDFGIFPGFMIVDTQPSYAITVRLETIWNPSIDGGVGDLVSGSTTLYSGSGHQRPAFEFTAAEKINPYFFPPTAADTAAGRDEMTVRMPPRIRPTEEALLQLERLAHHQGVNTAMACQDVRDDLDEDQNAAIASRAGIEFSELRNGSEEIPHRKRVTGQLWNRKLNIASDFPEALWLLRATRCDATLGDLGAGDAYYYHLGLKAAIEADHNLQVRDGVHVAWSGDRGHDIELYQV